MDEDRALRTPAGQVGLVQWKVAEALALLSRGETRAEYLRQLKKDAGLRNNLREVIDLLTGLWREAKEG